MNEPTPVKDRIALVTGGSRGIGRAIAEQLGRDGLSVAINFQSNEKAAQEAVEAITKNGGRAKAFQANIADPLQAQDLFKQVKAAYGSVHVLVNNAGITRDNLFLMMKPEEWGDVIGTNLSGIFQITKLVAKEMLRNRWGRIVNLSSVASTKGGRGQTNYSAAKAGINGFTVALAKEIGSKGITVNAIAPGVIVTDMTERVRGLASEEILNEITVGRFGEPQDVANLASFLASDRASYITGQVIYVDGGFRL